MVLFKVTRYKICFKINNTYALKFKFLNNFKITKAILKIYTSYYKHKNSFILHSINKSFITIKPMISFNNFQHEPH